MLRIKPPDGAPVTSDAPVLAGVPVVVDPVPGFDPKAPDNPLLRYRVAKGVDILESKATVAGQKTLANLAGGTTLRGTLAEIDFAALRPFTRIDFTKSSAGAARLMIQLGGTWAVPEKAGGVDFENYNPGQLFPELITTKALLSNVAEVEEVESETFPSNVTLRLGDAGVPFFFHQGELRPAGVEVPDFGPQLALALDACEPADGTCTLDLIAHSDAFGTITPTPTRIVYRAAHNSLVGLSFEERTVTVPAAGAAAFDLRVPSGLSLPSGRLPVFAVGLGVRAFGLVASVAGGSVGAGRRAAVVSARFQVGQLIGIDGALEVSAVHLDLLRRTAAAAITVELREDVQGEPRGAILATVSLRLRGAGDRTFGWLPVPLDEPAPLAPGSRVWVVLKADDGEVEWRGGNSVADHPPALFSADRGNTWRTHPFSANLVLQQAAGPAQPLALHLDVGGERQTLTIDPTASSPALDASSPLVRGLNQALADSAARAPREALPPAVRLTLSATATQTVQATFTRFDVTYTQTV